VKDLEPGSAAISDIGTFATTSFRNNASSGVKRIFLFFDARRSPIRFRLPELRP
jgi:hypothetical protein